VEEEDPEEEAIGEVVISEKIVILETTGTTTELESSEREIGVIEIEIIEMTEEEVIDSEEEIVEIAEISTTEEEIDLKEHRIKVQTKCNKKVEP
jgi:hypothetical protein